MTKRAGYRSTEAAGNVLSQTTYHRTPLADPSVCCLVLISPTQTDSFGKPPRVQGSYRRNVDLLTAAAQIVDMPVFVFCRNGIPESSRFQHQTFASEAHGCIWKNEGFTTALDAKDCTTIVLAGHWLDHEILVAALYALADRYEVYVPVDASPAHSKDAARLAEARLFRAGATPLLAKQVVQEWTIEACCTEQRAALMSLSM